MRTTIFCVHYQASHYHAECKAGVSYAQFRGKPFGEKPCFRRGGKCAGGCDKQQFPTDEDIAKEEAEFAALLERTKTARAAIVTHLGGPWKKGAKSAGGEINCPICGKENALRFSRAGYNGHIHAACKTDGCVAWME